MATCFWYVGNPTEQRIVDDDPRSVVIVTVVYQKERGAPLGLDQDEKGAQIAARMIADGAHFRTDTETLVRLPQSRDETLKLIRRFPTFSVVGSPDAIDRHIEQTNQYQSERRKAELRKRYNKQPTPQQVSSESTVIKIYDGDSDRLIVSAVDWNSMELDRIVKWRYSDFGLHAYVVLKNHQTAEQLKSSLAAMEICEVVEVESEQQLPVW